jgi:hypothetical protein
LNPPERAIISLTASGICPFSIFSRSATSASMDAYRASGFFDRHLSTTASSPGGMSCGAGTSARIGTGALYMCIVMMPMKFSASNGTFPEAISYRMMPSE